MHEAAREALFVCLHNVFVILDHGTQLSDEVLLFLVDQDGNELTPGALHEDFVAHLLDTGPVTLSSVSGQNADGISQ